MAAYDSCFSALVSIASIFAAATNRTNTHIKTREYTPFNEMSIGECSATAVGLDLLISSFHFPEAVFLAMCDPFMNQL